MIVPSYLLCTFLFPTSLSHCDPQTHSRMHAFPQQCLPKTFLLERLFRRGVCDHERVREVLAVALTHVMTSVSKLVDQLKNEDDATLVKLLYNVAVQLDEA